MRWFISFIGGIAVGLAWLAIWAYLPHPFDISLLQRKTEDRASRRERLKQMGKLRYILMFGLLQYGLSFGLALTIADVLAHDSRGWIAEISKLVFTAVFFGWFQGARSWGEIRGPVPFPPEYPPVKINGGRC